MNQPPSPKPDIPIPDTNGGSAEPDITDPDSDSDPVLYYETEYKGEYTVVCERCHSAFPHTEHRMNIAEKRIPNNDSLSTTRRACTICGCDTAHDQLVAHFSPIMDSPDDVYLTRNNKETYEQFKTFVSGLYGTEIVPSIHYDNIPGDDGAEIFKRLRITTLTPPKRAKKISQNISHMIEQLGLNSRVMNRLDGSGSSQMIIVGDL